jgi:RNA polymerase sigma-70 factor, ECF subfamily
VDQTPDQLLIEQSLAGRRDAFGLLVERYQNRLFHSLLHLLGSVEDAQDVAQEAFVQAFEKLSSFRGQSQFYSWLFRIAHNLAVSDRRRMRRVATSLENQREASGYEPTDENPSNEPSYSMDAVERQRIVQRALADLPEEFRTTLILKEMDGMSYEEIASTLGIPLGTVRSRIHRARMDLRDKLSVLLRSDIL